MASYMVYKPASAIKLTKPRLASSFASHCSDTSSMKQEDFHLPDSSRTATVNLSPSPRQGASRFDHNIPDHVLQAWPVVYDVHSKRQEEEREQAAVQKRLQSTSLLSRRTTRTQSGIYRSSVITPGELEFMSSKRQAWRRSNTHPGGISSSCSSQRPLVKSYSGFHNDVDHVFVTQDLQHDCDMYRDMTSRLTAVTDGRLKITPSTIEVTLPGLHPRSKRSQRKLQQQAENNARDDQTTNGTSDPEIKTYGGQTQNLLSRQKAERNNIRKRSPGSIRRQEELRQEQQFILQPTTMSCPDWYESNGLKTPTVLQKYLTETFYTAPPKPEIDTSAILNYIRDKQTKVTYVPPPPSSGSACEEEDFKDEPLSPTTDHNPKYEKEPKQKVYNDKKYESMARSGERTAMPLRRTQRENGGLDLTVGGGKIQQKVPGLQNSDHEGGSVGRHRVEPNRAPPPPPPARNDQSHTANGNHSMHQHDTEVHNETDTEQIIHEEQNEQEHIEEEEYVNETVACDVEEGKGHHSDSTKRITVVLPSSESP